MGRPSPVVLKFMEAYGVDSDEIWEVHGAQWVVKHKALERIAAEKGITWERPAMLECNSANGVAALVVFGKLGERLEWSIGEALIARDGVIGGNYKVTGKQAGYVYAMAEKRAKDRVILKLLDAHGAVYSDAEADDFSKPANGNGQRENPHVTRPSDIVEPTEYDAQGHPVDNIPLGDREVTRLTKATARGDFAAATAELRACKSVTALQLWGSVNANRIASYPPDWAETMRGLYTDHLTDLRNGKAA